MLFIIIALIIYFLKVNGVFKNISNIENTTSTNDEKHTTIINLPEKQVPSLWNRSDVLHDPYAPPLKVNAGSSSESKFRIIAIVELPKSNRRASSGSSGLSIDRIDPVLI